MPAVGGWTARGRASSPGRRGRCGCAWAVSEPGSSLAGDRAHACDDGGVVAVEAAGDLGERQRGQLAGQVHRDLARARTTARRARGARAAPRGDTPQTAQTASWIAPSVGGSAVGRARRRPSGRPSARRTSGVRERLAAAARRAPSPGSSRPRARGRWRDAGGDLLRGSPGSGSWLGVGGEAPERRRSGCAGRAARARRAGPSRSGRAAARPARQRLRRAVAGEHDLLAGGVQRVEGVDELLLGVLLALEHLDVVDQQRVELAVAGLEGLGPVAAQRGDELGREALGGRVVDLRARGGCGRRYSTIAPSRWVLPSPGGPWRKSGL